MENKMENKNEGVGDVLAPIFLWAKRTLFLTKYDTEGMIQLGQLTHDL